MPTFNESLKSYEIDQKDNHRNDEIEIGDIKQPDQFYPQVKFLQWDNETNFSIRLDEDIKDSTNKLEDDKVIWKSADLKKEVYLYELEDGFEFEVILLEKPESNIITYTLQTKGLNFFYQPELTEQEIKDGHKRPENVVGSYAVYHSTERNNITGRKEYRTGKAFHIYRPLAVDAQGSTTWCKLNIDTTSNLLTIEIPQEFLEEDVFPIIIDPTFGNIDTGGSSYTTSANRAYVLPVVSPSAGVVDKMTISCSNSGDNFKGLIADDSPEPYPLLTNGIGNAASVPASQTWVDSVFSTPPTITATDYLIGFIPDAAIEIYFDTTPHFPNFIFDMTNSYASPGDIDHNAESSQDLSIYATYTPDPPLLHYYKGSIVSCELGADPDVIFRAVGIRAIDLNWYAQLVATDSTDATDLFCEYPMDGVIYSFASSITIDAETTYFEPSIASCSGPTTSDPGDTDDTILLKGTSSVDAHILGFELYAGFSGGVSPAKLAVWDSTGNLICVSQSFSNNSEGWNSHSLAAGESGFILNGDYYYLGFIAGGSSAIFSKYDACDAGTGGYIVNNYSTPTDFDPGDITTNTEAPRIRLSIKTEL